ncbi:hypothetical protein P8452_71176 [Trifolium repens]|nr:hypothetical protein P8452_71176 [Trifolium repens]
MWFIQKCLIDCSKANTIPHGFYRISSAIFATLKLMFSWIYDHWNTISLLPIQGDFLGFQERNNIVFNVPTNIVSKFCNFKHRFFKVEGVEPQRIWEMDLTHGHVNGRTVLHLPNRIARLLQGHMRWKTLEMN